MTFLPGVSGNPQGMGLKKAQQKRIIADLFSDHVDAAVDTVISLLRSDDPQSKQWAAKIILEYCFGKPAQAVEISPQAGASFKIIVEGHGG